MLLRLMLLAAVALGSATPLAAAATPDVGRLLDVGWRVHPDARAAAARIHEQLREEYPRERRIDYAYALVLMQQRRYADAVKTLEQYLRFSPKDLHALRAKAWLAMLLREPTVALAELDKLSTALAADAARPIADEEEAEARNELHEDLVRFMGRMIGFLEGPAEGSVSFATLNSAKRKLTGRLGESLETAFKEGRSAVIDQHDVLAGAKSEAQEEVIAKAEQEKRDTLADLDRQEVEIAARQNEINTSAAEIDEQARAAAEAYAREDAPLQNELSRIASQLAAVERELSIVVADILSLDALARRHRDPIERARIYREIDRLEAISAGLSGERASIERAASRVQAQRAVLNAAYRRTESALAASLLKLRKEANSLENKLRRGEAMREELKKPTTGNTGQVIALRKEAEALTTYDTFPLELEKQRLLEAFAPAPLTP